MALMKRTQRSFAGGMLDKDLTGRQDLAKYSQGCLELTNFKVRKQGNVIKRPGTDLVCDFSDVLPGGAEVQSAKLIPLVQERERGLYVLITGRRAYLVSPDGMKMADGTWSRTPTSGAEPYCAEVPFDDSDLRMLDWCQSGDTLFFAHRSYPPGRMVYAGGTLAYERLEFRQGLGTPPRISSVSHGGGWTGQGGVVHLEYVATAVKDGVETGPSVPFAVEYNAPWPSDGTYTVTIDTSNLDPDGWDCFYVYKKISDVFGLVGTTSGQKALVNISSGFNINIGTYPLYPPDYSFFDKTVHLREGGNKFASVCRMENRKVTTSNGVIEQASPDAMNSSAEFTDVWQRYGVLENQCQSERTKTEDEETTYSATAQRRTNGSATSVEFTLPQNGVVFSKLSVSIGSLEHYVTHDKIVQARRHYYATGWNGSSGGIETSPHSVSVISEGDKWTGVKSIFTPCPAHYFRAVVEYKNASGQWDTETISAKAEVNQADPGTGWASEAAAVSGLPRCKREYTEDDAMYSYSDAASVTSRMDANAPAVGATVEFEIQSSHDIVRNGRPIRKVTVYGYLDQGYTTGAGLVVNGIACFKTGKYVNTFTDDNIVPDLTITPPKTEDHFVNPGEYPGCVQLYSQRLVYAASAKEPFTFWMSCTGDLYNFDVHEYVRASDAIKASTAALEMPRINRMLVHRDLMLFSDGGEWQVAPSAGNAVAPSTIAAKLQSVIGCAAWLKPIALDTDIVFCDGSGEALMATRYNFASDGYESSNLSVLSQRLFRNNPIRAMAYAQFPESTIECVLDDGTVASLVYMKEHEVCAWSRHVLGGGWKARDVAANKSVTAGSSHCAFLASRSPSGDGPTQWAVLAVRDVDPNDKTLLGNLRMDAVRTVDAAPEALRDGEKDVPVGQSAWAIGCPFKSVIKTTSPEFTDRETAQMEVKNATESEIRVIDGSDFTVRQPEVPATKATRMKVPCPVDKSGATFTVEPGDADCRMPLVGNNSRNGSVVVEHDGVLPLAVLSVTTSYRVEFANHANGGSADE